ncbi:MAG TPA: hypothetical protein VGD58_20665, partial [Herpetosiphonaceae bacterium]
CGLRTNGTVICWGANGYGQMFVPFDSFTQISSHGATSCGVRVDRTLVCWGDNRWSQATPLSGEFQAVSVGGRFACGLRIDGTLGCWGDSNAYYQIQPPSGTFVQVSAGAEHACALRANGSIVCWGRSDTGATTPPAPVFVTDPVDIAAPLSHVTTINTMHDTGDGRLDEDELVEGHILSFTVTFSGDITSFRTHAYLLVAEGATPGFQTTSCARVDPQDQRILLSSAFWHSEQTVTFEPQVPAPGSLPSGKYRLFVCDTVTGGYPLLDGDNNGIAGGSFVRNFSVLRPPMTPRYFIPITSK